MTFERPQANQFKGKQKTNEINHCQMWVLQNLDVLHLSKALNLLILNFCGRSKASSSIPLGEVGWKKV
jgi:hypothetical protein